MVGTVMMVVVEVLVCTRRYYSDKTRQDKMDRGFSSIGCYYVHRVGRYVYGCDDHD